MLQDIQLLLAAQCHLGTKNCDYQMERYVYKRRNDGIYIINLGKTWEKLQLAARVIVAIENPQDIVVQSARPYGQRAVLKFAHYVNAKALSGRHTPGEFFQLLVGQQGWPRRPSDRPMRRQPGADAAPHAACSTAQPGGANAALSACAAALLPNAASTNTSWGSRLAAGSGGVQGHSPQKLPAASHWSNRLSAPTPHRVNLLHLLGRFRFANQTR